jgi:serine/threonine-protein kinase
MTEWLGKIIGKVKIEKALARGGMAQVYYGTHTTLAQAMAVKVMLNYLDDADMKERFQREARVISALRHPNIVKVFDFDVVDGQPCIVMEYLSGPSLAAHLRDLHARSERMDLSLTARLIGKIASALSYAHAQGMIHRDVKPGNIMLHSQSGSIIEGATLPADTEPVLTDFGLVRLLDSAQQSASGVIAGTPTYMSPEQARGDKVDHRADIYSLGVMLYEMISGHVPFEADTSMAVLMKHIQETPQPIAGLAPELQTIIDRALAKDADLRYQSADDLARDLQASVDQLTVRKSKPDDHTIQFTESAPKKIQPRSKPKLALWIGGAAIIALALISIFASKSLLAALAPSPASTNAPAQAGSLRFTNLNGIMDSAYVTLWDETLTGGNGLYEVWLLAHEGETRRSIGTLKQENQHWVLQFSDSDSQNLFTIYDRMEITLEPDPDGNPNPSGIVIYSSIFPSDAGAHIHHLLSNFSVTPNQIALMQGLAITVKQIDDTARAMSDAFESNDIATANLKAEEIVNMIAGNQNTDQRRDWNSDGTINDLGDGFGLLLNGGQSGYIEGVSSHTQYALDAPDASAWIRTHGAHVRVCAANISNWSVELRDLAIEIAQSSAPEAEKISRAVFLADVMLNGINIDANETIDPIPGECGLLTAYEHSYYLAEFQIFPGAAQTPPPAGDMDHMMPTPDYYDNSGG